MEPPVSVPRAKRTSPAATATADPPEEPPGTRSAHQGFFTGPNAEFSFELPIANSSRFVLPTITAPWASRRSTTVAEYTGTYPSRMREPAVVGIFCVPMMSLHAHGIPVRSGTSPSRRRASAALACSRAWSSERWSQALWRSARDRSSASSASSRALAFRARKSSLASRIERGSSVTAALSQSRGCAAETRLRPLGFPRRGKAAPRSRPFFQNLLHAEEFAVAPALRRVGEGLVAGKARTDLVLTHDIRDRQHRCGRRHLLGVDLFEPLDRLEDHRELPGEPLDLIFREGDPRESSGLFDDGAIDCHYRSLPASQLQVTPGLIGRGDDWDVFLYSAYSSRLQNTRFPCRSNAFMRIVGCSPGPPTLPTEVRRPGCNGPRPSSTSWPESNANFTLTSWSRSFRTVASYPSSQATMNTARKAAAIRTRILYLPAKREISGSPRTRMPTITEVVAPSNTQAAATSFAAFADG